MTNVLKFILSSRRGTLRTLALGQAAFSRNGELTRKVSSLSSDEKTQAVPRLKDYAFFGIPIALTLSLGAWQVYRLKRKEAMIADRESLLALSPLDEKNLMQMTITGETTEYRHVRLEGKFLHEYEFLVGPRSAPSNLPAAVAQWGGSSGFQIVTPFRTTHGSVVLVIRGWVPRRLCDQDDRIKAAVSPLHFVSGLDQNDFYVKEREQRAENHDSESIAFVGVVKGSKERINRFTPENQPERNEWFYVDAKDMMKSLDLPRAAPDMKQSSSSQVAPVVELISPYTANGWPFPKTEGEFLKFPTSPSSHIIYAVTWFTLSAAITLMSRQRLYPRNNRSSA